MAAPRVLILATGGTIAGQIDTSSALGYRSGALTGEQLIQSVPGLREDVDLRIEQIANVGSQNMTENIWRKLRARIELAIKEDQAEGIVITHGTDTLEESSFFLYNVLPANIAVVLTGAMNPGQSPHADGPANLQAAVDVCINPASRGRAPMVVMNGSIFDPRYVVKTHTTSVAAFESIQAPALGTIKDRNVQFELPARPASKSTFDLPEHKPLARVAIIYAHVDMDPTFIFHATMEGSRGIVLAGMGNGNAPQGVLDALAGAVQRGTVVVRASHVQAGPVIHNLEVDDDLLGFNTAGHLSVPKSRVLLQILISNAITEHSTVQKAFDGFAPT